MKRLLAVAAAVAVLAVPSWAGLANNSFGGTAVASTKGIYALVGEVAFGKGPLELPVTVDSVGLATTDTGWTLSGGSFGTLSGVFGTTKPGKQYGGTVAQADVNTWVQDRLAATYAGVSDVAATGVLVFRLNGDGSRNSVLLFVVFTARLDSGQYISQGFIKVKAKLAPV
jgi:hypothetical protein